MRLQNLFSTSSDHPKWERTPDGFLRCRARVLAERIMPYARHELTEVPDGVMADPVRMLVTRETMGTAESLRSLEGIPITIGDHHWLTPDLVKEFGKGAVAGTPVLDGPYLVCDLLVTDPEAIEAIETFRCPEISAAYTSDTVFEPGEWDGQPYDAKQTRLLYNHIAVIPKGDGRAGPDVRILNKQSKGEEPMVKYKLANGKYVNVDEEAAGTIEESEGASGKSLEALMAQVEDLNQQIAALQGEAEEGKGELSVYKEKLDELLNPELLEAAAGEMVEEKGEAEEIIENAFEEKNEEKDEIQNSIKGLYGTKLHTAVLTAVGVKCENLSPEVLKATFKAQHQITNAMKAKRLAAPAPAKVAGAKMFNAQKTPPGSESRPQRSAMERLGFKKA